MQNVYSLRVYIVCMRVDLISSAFSIALVMRVWGLPVFGGMPVLCVYSNIEGASCADCCVVEMQVHPYLHLCTFHMMQATAVPNIDTNSGNTQKQISRAQTHDSVCMRCAQIRCPNKLRILYACDALKYGVETNSRFCMRVMRSNTVSKQTHDFLRM